MGHMKTNLADCSKSSFQVIMANLKNFLLCCCPLLCAKNFGMFKNFLRLTCSWGIFNDDQKEKYGTKPFLPKKFWLLCRIFCLFDGV